MTPKERQKRQGMKGSERGVGKIVPADEDRGANIFYGEGIVMSGKTFSIYEIVCSWKQIKAFPLGGPK